MSESESRFKTSVSEETENTFVLLDSKTGKPLRVVDEKYLGRETVFTASEPIWKGTYIHACQLKMYRTETYNAGSDCPCLQSDISLDDIEVAGLHSSWTQRITRGPWDLPLRCERPARIEEREIPFMLARRLFQIQAQTSGPWTLVLYDTKAKDATQKELFLSGIGRKVFMDKWSLRRLLAVENAREEYLELGDLELVFGPLEGVKE